MQDPVMKGLLVAAGVTLAAMVGAALLGFDLKELGPAFAGLAAIVCVGTALLTAYRRQIEPAAEEARQDNVAAGK